MIKYDFLYMKHKINKEGRRLMNATHTRPSNTRHQSKQERTQGKARTGR
jgi:hypothetical protein